MAFSGSRDYTESYTAASLILSALRKLGILDMAEGVNSSEETAALVTLNLIVKEWTAKGADVWLRKTGHLFLNDPGTVDGYTFGTSGSGYFTSLYYTTTVATAAAASATTLVVTDDTNMSNTDIILIENDDGTLTDTTISGAPSSNSVTLAAGLDSAVAAGNIVYSWPTTSNIDDKVSNLVYVNRRVTNTDNAATNAGYMEGVDSPVRMIGEEEYQSLSTKLQTGAPVSVYLREAAVNPELFIWPTGGTDNHHSLVIEYLTYFQDLDATTNNLDLPPEGVNALVYQLACELAPEYGLSIQEQRNLKSISDEKVEAFFDYMVEDAPVVFSQNYMRRR